MATKTPNPSPKPSLRPHLAATLLVVAAGLMAWATRSEIALSTFLLAVPIMGLLQWFWWRNADTSNPKHLSGLILAGIVAHVLTALVANPLHTSDDINRYVFEGHVVAAGGNPYEVAPASPLFDDLSQDASLETIRKGVNNSRIATIYPPVAEFLFALGSRLSPNLGGWIFITLLFDVLLILLLPKLLDSYGRDSRWSVVYIFHPLVLMEGIGGGHVDLVAVAFLVFSLLALKRGKKYWAWIFFALSVLSKVVTLIVGFSLLIKGGWKGMILAGVLVASAVAWCFLPGRIVPQPQAGSWKIIEGVDRGTTIQYPFKDPAARAGSTPLVTASGLAMIVLDESEEPPRSTWLLHHSDLKAAATVDWNNLLGQYRIVAFSDTWRHLDGKSIRFDGQGRLAGALDGSYWIDSPQTFSLSHNDQLIGKFWMSEDLLLCVPTTAQSSFYLVKLKEKVGMGFRHYGGRWTANAPLFRAIENFMPGPDEYDAGRKQAQKFVVAILLILALVFAARKTPLPTATVWLLFALWILAPAVYPWYLLWLVPFLPFSRSKAPLMLSYSCLAMHLSGSFDYAEILVFGPVVMIIVLELFRRMNRATQ